MDSISKIKIGRDCVINFEALLIGFSGSIVTMKWESYSDDPEIRNWGTLTIGAPRRRLPIFTMKNVSADQMEELCEIFGLCLKDSTRGFEAVGVIRDDIIQEATV